MADARKNRVFVANFGKAIKAPSEYLKFAITDNPKIWYALIINMSGNDDEYAGGEYLVRIELPEDFPYKPPSFYFLTPNGLYKPESNVCISIGEYHSDDYRSSLGVIGFCENLISGLIGWTEIGHGINIIKTTIAQKKQMAIDSKEYNRTHNAHILDQIDQSFAAYSTAKKWPRQAIPAATKEKLGLRDDDL